MDHCLDPVNRDETDSEKLTVNWAMKNTAVAPVLEEVFGAGHSLEHYEFQHEKYNVHLKFKCEDFIDVQKHEGSLQTRNQSEVNGVLEMFVDDVWVDHLNWMKQCKEHQCKDGHQPVWSFRFLGFENYEKKTLLDGVFNKESDYYESYFRVEMKSTTALRDFRNKIVKAHDFKESLDSENGAAFWLKKKDGTDFGNDDEKKRLIDLALFKAITVDSVTNE